MVIWNISNSSVINKLGKNIIHPCEIHFSKKNLSKEFLPTLEPFFFMCNWNFSVKSNIPEYKWHACDITPPLMEKHNIQCLMFNFKFVLVYMHHITIWQLTNSVHTIEHQIKHLFMKPSSKPPIFASYLNPNAAPNWALNAEAKSDHSTHHISAPTEPSKKHLRKCISWLGFNPRCH